MRYHHYRLLLAVFVVTIGVPAFATDGYFSIGCGTKQLGQGGARVALPQDSPRGRHQSCRDGLCRESLHLGLTYFRPIRSASITDSQAPVNGADDASWHKNFFIPELGFNHLVNSRFSLGVSICGNGGMNTSYTTPIPLLGTTRAGVDLEQLFVSPTAAFKLSEHSAVGISLNIGWQRFSGEGLQNFTQPGFSIDPANLTNRGYNASYGLASASAGPGNSGDISAWVPRSRAEPTCRNSTSIAVSSPSRAGLIFPQRLLAAWL